MLVVDSIVPGSFAESLLEPGDVVTRVEGKVVTHFLALEDLLDAAVGQEITLGLERGGQPLQATVKVDLTNPVLPMLAYMADSTNIHKQHQQNQVQVIMPYSLGAGAGPACRHPCMFPGGGRLHHPQPQLPASPQQPPCSGAGVSGPGRAPHGSGWGPQAVCPGLSCRGPHP